MTTVVNLILSSCYSVNVPLPFKYELMLTSAFSDDYRQLNLSPSAKKRRNLCTGQFLACVAASPRTHQSHLYSPLYTEGLERLRSRQGRSGPHLCISI